MYITTNYISNEIKIKVRIVCKPIYHICQLLELSLRSDDDTDWPLRSPSSAVYLNTIVIANQEQTIRCKYIRRIKAMEVKIISKEHLTYTCN